MSGPLARADAVVSLFDRGLPKTGAEHFLVRRLARLMLRQEPLVVGVIGSSNSAGHDNYVNDSYPAVLQAALQDALRPTGIDVILRNAGIGNTKTLPHCFCLPTMLGSNADVYQEAPLRGRSPGHVDVVVWEYLMNDAGTYPECSAWYETFVRSAVRDVKAAAVLFTHIESGRDQDQRNQGTRQPPLVNYHDNEPPHRTLRDHYRSHVCMNNLFTKDALWPVDDQPGFRLEDLFGALHPLPTGHRFIAHQLARYLLHAASAALLEIDTVDAMGRAALAGYKVSDAAAAAAAVDSAGDDQTLFELEHPLVDLPDPLMCEHVVCDSRPMCVTSFLPHASAANVSMQWATLETGHGWSIQLLEGEHLHPERHYLDRKEAMMGTSATGWLILNATTVADPGLIFVCEPAKEWGRETGILRSALEFQLDGQPLQLPPSEHQSTLARGLVYKEHCVEISKSAKPGFHKLGLKVVVEQKKIYISHLITT